MFNLSDVKVDSDPFPHVVIDNAIHEDREMLMDFPKDSDFGEGVRMHGDLCWDDLNYEKLINKSVIYNRFHQYVYSEKFINDVVNIFKNFYDDELHSNNLLHDPRIASHQTQPRENRTPPNMNQIEENTDKFILYPRFDIGVGKLNYGLTNGGGGIHTDNRNRLISILYFLGDDYMIGGEHRLYGVSDNKPFLSKTIKPKHNRLVISLQTNKALHDVNPVSFIEGSRKAFYLAISSNKSLWNYPSSRILAKLTRNRYQPTYFERLSEKIYKKLFG